MQEHENEHVSLHIFWWNPVAFAASKNPWAFPAARLPRRRGPSWPTRPEGSGPRLGRSPEKKGGAHETHPKFHDFRKLDWIRSLTIIIYDDIYEKNTFMSSDMFFTTSPFDSRPAPCGNGTHSIRSSTQLALLRKKGTGFSSPPTIDQRGKEPLDQNMQKQS